MSNLFGRLKGWATKIKKDLNALRIALREDTVPWYAKALIILTVAYALSPIDLIPDFIPVIGLLDDIIIVPLLMYFAIKLIPPTTFNRCRAMAETQALSDKKNWIAGALVLVIWIAVVIWLIMRWME